MLNLRLLKEVGDLCFDVDLITSKFSEIDIYAAVVQSQIANSSLKLYIKNIMKMILQSRLGKSTLLFITIASAMLFTNPKKDTYVDYAAKRLTTEIQTSICRTPKLTQGLFWEEVSKITSNSCKSGLATGLTFQSSSIKEFIANSTEQQNFFVFSAYTTKVSQYNFKTIGVFGNFLTFQK
ncbi:DUF4359 domain-containing protein [Chlorogloeopsis sp. ULAP01]|uniref:DUF4359 domain-containing protein n=1 Tax=Chlorogloeopsis sp. ULAP01 TaxID=3056483 RepID=UPI0025AB0F07|nr:DUF4359 domain-containing protein [Chlorogloeopsis sp. ULAP01]MDM9379213.1 DUF4359 domain-containing protein [Chlorogloeopsis sp. ULAP01]